MHRTRVWMSATVLLLACALSAVAQQSTDVTVPTLVNFSGTLTDVNGKPLTEIMGVTFYLYQDQQGGAPLWMETQNVQPDRMGHYSVMLGSTTSQGLSPDLFASGQARWLGVQAQGQEEQPRVMLLSVPYAMKAVDAQTIGGLPPSAFVLAAPPTANAARAMGGSKAASVPATSSDVTTTGGTADKIPMFTTATNIQNSILSQTGTTAINVGGNLNLPATGRFELGGKLFAFGSYANDNAFLGFAGNTKTTGTYNTAVGEQALGYNTTGSYNTAIAQAALELNTTGSENTAVGDGALVSNTTGSNNTASGGGALSSNTTGSNNTASGYFVLSGNTTGYENTADGVYALYSNTTGPSNTATGYEALYLNTSGSGNTASGYHALYDNSTGSTNTGFGSNSGTTYDGSKVTGVSNSFIGNFAIMATGGLSYATAIGACSEVSASNALVLGANNTSSGDAGFFCTSYPYQYTNVGIDVSNPSKILTVLQGGGPAIADGWSTYSSRRWKTNIHPLHNALSKVEQLRGVSYDLKDSGKHEIGVIAEEVGQVLPEVVSYEKNGKDATGVDYSRLTALLIEAMKQQQKQIALQQTQIRKQHRLMTTQQHEIAGLSRKVGVLESSLRTGQPDKLAVLALK
jgi:trimeric autotransporter adhesin